tara:strand:+ start:22 stop:438 length:417 start_codon:yes stop_codon:yes gene_type:complete
LVVTEIAGVVPPDDTIGAVPVTEDTVEAVNATVPVASGNVIVRSAVGSVTLTTVSYASAVDPSKVITGFDPWISMPAMKVANSVTDKVPLTLVNCPDAAKNGVPVAQDTTSEKFVFICDATIDVPAVNEFDTAKAAII